MTHSVARNSDRDATTLRELQCPPDLNEDFWEDLLTLVEDGKVIPVIGAGVVARADDQAIFYPWLARRLAIPLEAVQPRSASTTSPRPISSTGATTMHSTPAWRESFVMSAPHGGKHTWTPRPSLQSVAHPKTPVC